jgi:hypothetical protein
VAASSRLSFIGMGMAFTEQYSIIESAQIKYNQYNTEKLYDKG